MLHVRWIDTRDVDPVSTSTRIDRLSDVEPPWHYLDFPQHRLLIKICTLLAISVAISIWLENLSLQMTVTLLKCMKQVRSGNHCYGYMYKNNEIEG